MVSDGISHEIHLKIFRPYSTMQARTLPDASSVFSTSSLQSFRLSQRLALFEINDVTSLTIGVLVSNKPINVRVSCIPIWRIIMVDCVAAVSRTVKRKGTGLETPNYGSSCKGSIFYLLSKSFLYCPENYEVSLA